MQRLWELLRQLEYFAVCQIIEHHTAHHGLDTAVTHRSLNQFIFCPEAPEEI